METPERVFNGMGLRAQISDCMHVWGVLRSSWVVCVPRSWGRVSRGVVALSAGMDGHLGADMGPLVACGAALHCCSSTPPVSHSGHVLWEGRAAAKVEEGFPLLSGRP